MMRAIIIGTVMLPKNIIAQYNTIIEPTNNPGKIAMKHNIRNNMNQNISVNFLQGTNYFSNIHSGSVLAEVNLVLKVFVQDGAESLVEFEEAEAGAVVVLAEVVVQDGRVVVERGKPFAELFFKVVERKAGVENELVRSDSVASVKPWLHFISVGHS